MRTYPATTAIAGIGATVPVGSITVRARRSSSDTYVTLTPQVHGDPVAESVIAKTEIIERDGVLVVTAPEPAPAGPGRTGGNRSAGVTNVIAGTVGGSIVQIGSLNVINGQVVSGGGINVDIIVPVGISAILTNPTGAITTFGSLGTVQAETDSGSLTFEVVDRLTATGKQGSISVSQVGRVTARTTYGSIKVGMVSEHANLATTYGSIRVARTDTSDIAAHTVYGSVTVGRGPGIVVSDGAVSTAYGRMRVR